MIDASPQAPDLPPVIGHRGAAAAAPENTLASLRKAKELGATWVEFDVKLTRDGHPVLFHDDRLDRTTSGQGEVALTTLAQLRKLDAGAWFAPAFEGERVPSFADALALCAELGLGINVELKPCPGREADTARVALETLLEHWPERRPAPLISSFARVCLVVACEVLEHLAHPERALAEIARVARGRVVLSVPREPLWRALNLARGAYWREAGNTPGHVQHWSRAEFVALVARTFRVLDVWSPTPWTVVAAELR